MTTSSTIQFIDTVLFSNPSVLSYNDHPNQKSLIRNHILELIHDFPTFDPSIDTYFHFDGTSMNLLNVTGLVHVSKFLPDVHLLIWVHASHPIMAPMVFILSNPDCPIHANHPFIDKSGLVAPDHLNWDHRRSSTLRTLVHNLVNLFLHDHPSMPSSIFKVTLLDDLVTKVCNDFSTMNTRISHEIEELSLSQVELRNWANHTDEIITSLVSERENLEEKVIELRKRSDGVSKWLRIDMGSMEDRVEKLTFEAVDEVVLDCRAADRALEDVMYALDKGFLDGVMDFEAYMRQVRVVAREQFHHRAVLLKLQALLA